MMLTFDKIPQSNHSMMVTFEEMPQSHHSMMLTFDKDASVASQYDVNIRQGCLSYITV